MKTYTTTYYTMKALQLLMLVLLAPCLALAQTCPPGTFSATGSAPCTPCPAGQSQPGIGQTSCVPCAAGSYQQIAGSTSCNLCTAGTANPSTGSASSADCTFCLAGSFSSSGAASCTPCGVGDYNTTIGNTSCLECAAGSYQPTTGQTSCLLCPTGTYQDGPGAGLCSSCNAGSYNPSTGSASASDCLSCAAGFYQPEKGAADCLACGVGTYQPSTGQEGCLSCPAGSYSFTTAAVDCSSCSSRGTKIVFVLKPFNKTARKNGKFEGIFSLSAEEATAIRPDLHGLKFVIEKSDRAPAFTALLPAGSSWTGNARQTLWKFRDASSETGVNTATVRVQKKGSRYALIVALSMKRAAIALTKADLPMYITLGFGSNGISPCSQTKIGSKKCAFRKANTEMTCKS